MKDLNGGVEQALPEMKIAWDAESQTIRLSFDPLQFKTWDFVRAALRMAEVQAEQMQKAALLQNMQREQVAAQQNLALAGKLRLPR